MNKQQLSKIVELLKNRWGKTFNNHITNVIFYGSGVLPQTNNIQNFNKNTLDIIIQVKNSSLFHHDLYQHNPNQYGGLSYLIGPKWLNLIQRNIFPMHSNHINLNGKNIKYSIVNKSVLRQDLQTWKYMSFAGRLHKPVNIYSFSQENINIDILKNRQNAVAVTLLSLGGKSQNLTYFNFFYHLCNLSYGGDVRFTAGVENPNKIQNIVKHNFNLLKQIYVPILKKFSGSIPQALKIQQQKISFSFLPPAVVFLLYQLPSVPKEKIEDIYPGQQNLGKKIYKQGSYELPKKLSNIINAINRTSSSRMALQNILTGSPLNNINYILAKYKKKNNN